MRPIIVFVATLLLVAPPALARPAAPHVANTSTGSPVVTRTLAGSGAALYGLQDTRLPRVWYHLYLEAGERFVPARFAGLSSVAAEVLERGPASVPFASYRQDLFRRGTEIRWEASNRFLIAHVKCLPAQLPAVTALVKLTTQEPRLDDATFKQVLELVTNQRASEDDNMSLVTTAYGKQKLWDFRPEARLPDGWASAMLTIQRTDMTAYLKTHLAAPAGFVSTAAPVPPEKVAAGLAPVLAGWLKPLRTGRTPVPTGAMTRRIVLIDKPGATDNQIYLLSPLPVDLTRPDGAAAEVYFALMGSDLGSRLGKALRVERGLTYGANSAVRRVEWPQWFAYSFGGIVQTPKIVAGMFELFGAKSPAPTADEVVMAKSKLLQAYAADMESPAQQLDAVSAAVAQGLPASYPFERPHLIAATTLDKVVAVSKLATGFEHATIVVMGDASKLKDGLVGAVPAGTPIVVRKVTELGAEALAAGK
jgi:zinc protease